MPTLPITFDTLFAIYMNGFGTGVATAVTTTGGSLAATADAIADQVVKRLEGDPAAMEVLKQEVRDTVTGKDRDKPTEVFRVFSAPQREQGTGS